MKKAVRLIKFKDISIKLDESKSALNHFLHTHLFCSLLLILANSNIALLLGTYYPVFLRCTIVFQFSALIHYPFFIYHSLIFKFFITVYVYLLAYTCVYFPLFYFQVVFIIL